MKDFKRRSRGLMNIKYFNDLLEGKVQTGYWDNVTNLPSHMSSGKLK